jgi:hypothetical protein
LGSGVAPPLPEGGGVWPCALAACTGRVSGVPLPAEPSPELPEHPAARPIATVEATWKSPMTKLRLPMFDDLSG